ncbi:hypothetical protein ACFX13_009872 [Malus domestica]
MALGSTIIHLQDQALTALEESVLRSSFFQDQALTVLGSTIIHLQDQAQKPWKIRSSPLFKIKPQHPLKKRSSSRSSPNGSLKIRSNPPSRSSPQPLKNVHP